MKRIIIGLVGVVLIIGSIMFFSKEEETVLITDKQELDNTSLVFMLQDEEGNYNKADTLPSSGYNFNASKSICTNNTTPTWEDNKLYLNNLTKNGTSCYLYFDKPKAKDTILANSKLGEGVPNFANTSCSSGCDEATVGLYEETTSKGTTYYFRGDVTDNYLVFADKYWRIIRINEDGSVRVIYNGEKSTVDSAGKETVLANGYNDASTQYTQIQESAYNSSWNRSEYVGFTYTEGSQRPNSTNTGTTSTIKGVLDTWYSTNLQQYDNKITGIPGFCNDREVASGYEWSSQTNTHYKAYERFYTTHQPTFECNNSKDLYQTKIGLITIDELMYAGGMDGGNISYYLYTGNWYLTMSPCYFYGFAGMFYINSAGWLSGGSYVSDSYGVRPVINLDANVTLSGTGTISDPYVVD